MHCSNYFIVLLVLAGTIVPYAICSVVYEDVSEDELPSMGADESPSRAMESREDLVQNAQIPTQRVIFNDETPTGAPGLIDPYIRTGGLDGGFARISEGFQQLSHHYAWLAQSILNIAGLSVLLPLAPDHGNNTIHTQASEVTSLVDYTRERLAHMSVLDLHAHLLAVAHQWRMSGEHFSGRNRPGIVTTQEGIGARMGSNPDGPNLGNSGTSVGDPSVSEHASNPLNPGAALPEATERANSASRPSSGSIISVGNMEDEWRPGPRVGSRPTRVSRRAHSKPKTVLASSNWDAEGPSWTPKGVREHTDAKPNSKARVALGLFLARKREGKTKQGADGQSTTTNLGEPLSTTQRAKNVFVEYTQTEIDRISAEIAAASKRPYGRVDMKKLRKISLRHGVPSVRSRIKRMRRKINVPEITAQYSPEEITEMKTLLGSEPGSALTEIAKKCECGLRRHSEKSLRNRLTEIRRDLIRENQPTSGADSGSQT